MEGFEHYLEQYGYWVLFLGTFLEGETILVVAGYMVSAGYLSLDFVILVAFAGTFVGDQLYFFIGRRWGKNLVMNWKKHWRKRVSRVLALLRLYNTSFILTFRFFYGLRTVSPFAIGMARVAPLRFLVLNFLAAAVWAISFAYLGFFFGKAVEQFLGEVKSYQTYILGGIVAVALVVWLVNYLRQRKE